MRKRHLVSPTSVRRRPNSRLRRLFARTRKRTAYTKEAPLSWRKNQSSRTSGTAARFKTKTLLIVLAVVVVGWLVFVAVNSYFTISSVTLDGVRRLDYGELLGVANNELSSKNLGVFPGNNYFFLNEDTLAKQYLKHYPLDRVVVEKKFPNTLHISIKEKGTTLLYDNGSAYYYVDKQGSILEKAMDGAPDETVTLVAGATSTHHFPNITALEDMLGFIPVLYDERIRYLDSKSVSPPVLEAVLSAEDNLGRSMGARAVHHFSLDADNENFLTAYITNYTVQPFFLVHFSVDAASDNTWANFASLWSGLSDAQRRNLDYIDLRFSGRAFYQ